MLSVPTIIHCYLCSFIVTVERIEDKAKLKEAQAKLIAVEWTCHEHQIKIAVLEAKLAAMENAYRNDHEKYTLQIHEQKKDNALIQDEKRKLTKRVDELEGEVQHLSTQLSSLIPAQGQF